MLHMTFVVFPKSQSFPSFHAIAAPSSRGRHIPTASRPLPARGTRGRSYLKSLEFPVEFEAIWDGTGYRKPKFNPFGTLIPFPDTLCRHP